MGSPVGHWLGEDPWREGLLEKVCLEFTVEESGMMDGDSGGDGAGRPR